MIRNNVLLVLLAAVTVGHAQTLPAGINKLCTIYFNKDARRPARVEDAAKPCLLQATRALAAAPGSKLYLVGTADRQKDNEAGHGKARTEQDMTGEDLRYADVAAYRAVNTKAYLVRWLQANPKLVVPLTSYQDGQWVEFYLVKDGVSFKAGYGKATAPIMSRPCTVPPCAVGVEEFLVAQQRERIPK